MGGTHNGTKSGENAKINNGDTPDTAIFTFKTYIYYYYDSQCASPQLLIVVWDFQRNSARARGIFLRRSLFKVAAAAALFPSLRRDQTPGTLFLGFPHEKFHTKINTPRACENVPQLGVVTLEQHTAGNNLLL